MSQSSLTHGLVDSRPPSLSDRPKHTRFKREPSEGAITEGRMSTKRFVVSFRPVKKVLCLLTEDIQPKMISPSPPIGLQEGEVNLLTLRLARDICRVLAHSTLLPTV